MLQRWVFFKPPDCPVHCPVPLSGSPRQRQTLPSLPSHYSFDLLSPQQLSHLLIANHADDLFPHWQKPLQNFDTMLQASCWYPTNNQPTFVSNCGWPVSALIALQNSPFGIGMDAFLNVQPNVCPSHQSRQISSKFYTLLQASSWYPASPLTYFCFLPQYASVAAIAIIIINHHLSTNNQPS